MQEGKEKKRGGGEGREGELTSTDQEIKRAFLLSCVGRIEDAEKILKKNIEKNPKDAISRANLGVISILAQKYDFAILYLRQAIELEKGEPAIYANLGIAYYLYGDSRMAVESLNKSLEMYPEQPFWLLIRGVAKLRSSTDDTTAESAKNDFISSLQLDPASPFPYLGMYLTYILKGDKESASKMLEKAGERAGDDAELMFTIATNFHSLAIEENSPETMKKYYEKASEFYNRSISLAEDRIEILGLSKFFSSAISRDLGFYIESEDKMRSALSLFPELSTVEPPYDPKARYSLSLLFIDKGNIRAAEHELEQTIKLAPQFSKAYKILGQIKLYKVMAGLSKGNERIEELSKARELLERELDIIPSDDESMYYLAQVNYWLAKIGPKFQKQGSLIQSMTAISNAAKLNEKIEYLRLAGAVAYELKKYDDAISFLEKACRNQKPEDVSCYVLLARCYIENKEYKKAESVLLSIKEPNEDVRITFWELYKKAGIQDKLQSVEAEIINQTPLTQSVIYQVPITPPKEYQKEVTPLKKTKVKK